MSASSPQLEAQLLSLPIDITEYIATLLPSLADVNNLGRTCRHIGRLVNGLLYRLDAAGPERYALLWAATHGMDQTALHALAAGTPVDTVRSPINDRYYERGRSLGYLSQTSLEIAVFFSRKSIVNILLAAHADTTRTNKRGETIILKAAGWGDTAILRDLLDYSSAHINTASKDGNTPLTEAVRQGRIEAVRVLLSYDDIRIDLTYLWNNKPIFLTSRQGHEIIVLALLDHELRAQTESTHKFYFCLSETHATAACIEALLPYCHFRTAWPCRGTDLLNRACSVGNLPAVKVLLKHVVSVYVPASVIEAALGRARESGNAELVRFMVKMNEEVINATKSSRLPRFSGMFDEAQTVGSH